MSMLLSLTCVRSFTCSPQGDAAALVSTSMAEGTFDGSNTIERVAILGLRLGGSWSARVKGVGEAGQTSQAAFGPVWLRKGIPEVALIVRSPGVSAYRDWQIELRRS